MVTKRKMKNKKAYFDYYIEKEIEAGIVLTGTEIKSVRNGSANLKDSYAKIKKDEIYIINMFIAKYDNGSYNNQDERRTRKLLLHKKEIKRLEEYSNKEGYTLVPLELYFKNNKAKVKLGVAKGKHNYDKRQAIKERELLREAKNINNY